MKIDGKIIIITTKDELRNLIADAINSIGLESIPVRETYDRPNKKYITPKDIHREYGIHTKMLHMWRLEGVGPAYVTLGRRILYERKVIEQFITSSQVKTDSSFI